MINILNTEKMKQADSYTINNIGIPSIVLMEEAALSSYRLIFENFEVDKESKILVVAGVGNNGGDGIAIYRHFFLDGYISDLCIVGDRRKASEENNTEYDIVKNLSGSILDVDAVDYASYDYIVDCLFGIGVNRKISDPFYTAIEKINAAKGKVISIDVPSGMNSDTGKCINIGVKADLVIAIAYYKIGHFLNDGSLINKLTLAKISIPDTAIDNNKYYSLISPDELTLPKIDNSVYKTKKGRVVLVGGGIGMAGAISIAAKAAYKAGAGLVEIISYNENRTILQVLNNDAIFTDIKDEYSCYKAFDNADAILFGSGFKENEGIKLLDYIINKTKALVVIDAGGIRSLKNIEKIENKNIVITPHMGEFSYLINKSIDNIDRIEDIFSFSEKGFTVILKDYNTIIAGSDKVYLHRGLDSRLAIAGSGDALAGYLIGLLAVNRGYNSDIFYIAITSVVKHFEAGNYDRIERSPIGELIKKL